MAVSGVNFTKNVVTYSGISAYIVYTSGTNYSRIELYNFDGFAYNKAMMSGVWEILNYAYNNMPNGVDADPAPEQWYN